MPIHVTFMRQLKFTPIPIFSSNYIWLIEHIERNECYIVDPGCGKEVLSYIERSKLKVLGILVTHSHNDHIGGINDVLHRFSVPVIGPKCERIPQVTQQVLEGSQFELWPNIDVNTLHVPGHLPEHVIFNISEAGHANALMCGDIIFSSGCGRMFSGPAEAFHKSLSRVSSLDGATELYCAHEYTQANIEFALHIEPGNQALEQKRLQTTASLSATGCSLPTTVEIERQTNPFLRTHLNAVKQRALQLSGTRETEVSSSIDDARTFEILRKLKDVF